MRKYQSALSYLIPFIISLSVCVMLVKQVRGIALSHKDNTRTFYSFAVDLEDYKSTRKEWRTRILSNYLAGRLSDLIKKYIDPNEQQYAMLYLPSAWTAGWFLLSSITLIITFKAKSLLYIFGLYAGISFAYLPGMGITRVYPWDLPALFSFVSFVCIIEKQKHPWLVIMIPVAVLFKETAILLSIAFLFWDDIPMRKRLIYLIGTLGLVLMTKGFVDILTESPSPLFTMSVSDYPGTMRLWENFNELMRMRTNHPIFINAGLLISLLLLPHTSKQITMLKSIAIAFTVGIFMFGLIIEYRIWFELIPISLLGLDLVFYQSYDDPIP